MPPLTPSLETFGLDIEKKKIKISKDYLSKNNKNTLKLTGFKSNSRYKRLFASQDIHYNNSLNTEVQDEFINKQKL